MPSLEKPRQQQQHESHSFIAYNYLWVAYFVGHSKQISLYATKTSSSGKYWAVGLLAIFDKLLET